MKGVILTIPAGTPAALAVDLLTVVADSQPGAWLTPDEKGGIAVCFLDEEMRRVAWAAADTPKAGIPCTLDLPDGTACGFWAHGQVGFGVHLSRKHGMSGTTAADKRARAVVVEEAIKVGEGNRIRTTSPGNTSEASIAEESEAEPETWEPAQVDELYVEVPAEVSMAPWRWPMPAVLVSRDRAADTITEPAVPALGPDGNDEQQADTSTAAAEGDVEPEPAGLDTPPVEPPEASTTGAQEPPACDDCGEHHGECATPAPEQGPTRIPCPNQEAGCKRGLWTAARLDKHLEVCKYREGVVTPGPAPKTKPLDVGADSADVDRDVDATPQSPGLSRMQVLRREFLDRVHPGMHKLDRNAAADAVGCARGSGERWFQEAYPYDDEEREA